MTRTECIDVDVEASDQTRGGDLLERRSRARGGELSGRHDRFAALVPDPEQIS
jgi:hypothetical protein